MLNNIIFVTTGSPW